ncbi:unnamed protein product [Camellia sinensis]
MALILRQENQGLRVGISFADDRLLFVWRGLVELHSGTGLRWTAILIHPLGYCCKERACESFIDF